jgi:hypothetical protein
MHGRWLTLVCLGMPMVAQAGPLSPWGLHTASGETWLTPYVYVGRGSLSQATYLSIGLGDRFDLIGGFGFGWRGGFQPGALEAMPRFFVNDHVGLVVRVASVPGASQLEVGPEVHAGWRTGRLGFTANLGWRPALGEGGGVGQAFAVLGPELFFTDAFSLFVEVNPSVDLTDPGVAALTVVPGFGLARGAHGVALGVTLPTDDLAQRFTVGGWYSVSPRHRWGPGSPTRAMRPRMASRVAPSGHAALLGRMKKR